MEKWAKYLSVFKVSWQEIFIWRTNFVLWRLRNVFQILILYFFWSTVFSNQDHLFGYTRTTILTYVLGSSLIRSMVLSSRSVDVAGEIHQGILTNYLLKPISYLSYWWTRDLADKILNIIFSICELALIVWLLKPPILLQTDPLTLVFFGLTVIIALHLYFYFSFILSFLAFWVREVWAPRFLAIVSLEFLSGGVFPLDILPPAIFSGLQFLPFTYLVFFPLKVYLGQLSIFEIMSGIAMMTGWTIILFFATQYLWMRGLRVYSAEGR